MPLLPALRAFFTRLLTDVDDALFRSTFSA